MNENDYTFESIGPYQKILWMNIKDNHQIIGDKEAISAWLMDDVRDYIPILGYIDAVLKGEKEEELIWGNGYKAFVKPDITEIHFNYEEEDPSMKPCSLPTTMLREIVEIWFREYKKFKEQQQNN